MNCTCIVNSGSQPVYLEFIHLDLTSVAISVSFHSILLLLTLAQWYVQAEDKLLQLKEKLDAAELKLQQSLPKVEALPTLEAELRQRLEALSKVLFITVYHCSLSALPIILDVLRMYMSCQFVAMVLLLYFILLNL